MGQPWKYPKLHIFYHTGCYYSRLKRTRESIRSTSAASVPWYRGPCTRELKVNSPTTKPGAVFLQSFPGCGGDPCNKGEESTSTFNQTPISELPPSHVKPLTHIQWPNTLHQQNSQVESIISSETRELAHQDPAPESRSSTSSQRAKLSLCCFVAHSSRFLII